MCCNKQIRRGFSHNWNYYSSGMNAASINKIINRRSNIETSGEAPMTTRNNRNHFCIAIWNQSQKVHTQLEPGPELRWGNGDQTLQQVEKHLWPLVTIATMKKPISKSPHVVGTRSRYETGDVWTILPPSNLENSFLPSWSIAHYFVFKGSKLD